MKIERAAHHIWKALYAKLTKDYMNEKYGGICVYRTMFLASSFDGKNKSFTKREKNAVRMLMERQLDLFQPLDAPFTCHGYWFAVNDQMIGWGRTDNCYDSSTFELGTKDDRLTCAAFLVAMSAPTRRPRSRA